MRARSIRTSLALATAASLLAACGSSSSGGSKANAGNAANQTPTAELASAIHALGDAQTLNLKFSLGASGADLLQIASGLGGNGPTKAQADAIGKDHIGIELQAAPGKSLGDGTPGSPTNGGAFALTLGDDSTDYFTLESVAGTLYARIDLRYFLGLINGAPSFNSLQRQVSGAPAFIGDALAGKWISLPAATLKSLTSLAQGQSGATPNTSAFAGLRSKLLSTLLADVQVSKTASGGNDDLLVTFQLRKLISDEYTAIAPILSSAIPGGSGLPALKPTDIPNVTVHFDAFVTNGVLSKVVLDAGQFDTKEHISVPLDLDIAQSGPTIAAPSGSTPIDLSSLGQLFAGAQG